MKKIISLLLIVILVSITITGCGKSDTVDSTNTISPAELSPREQMLADNQDIFLYDVEFDSTFRNVELSVELYKNGVRGDDVLNFRSALPSNAEKNGNNFGSIAVILGSDARFTASICDKDGTVNYQSVTDSIQPISSATFQRVVNKTAEYTPINGTTQVLAYLAYGDESKTQGTFDDNVFLDPAANEEKAAAFDYIYLIKCRFS